MRIQLITVLSAAVAVLSRITIAKVTLPHDIFDQSSTPSLRGNSTNQTQSEAPGYLTLIFLNQISTIEKYLGAFETATQKINSLILTKLPPITLRRDVVFGQLCNPIFSSICSIPRGSTLEDLTIYIRLSRIDGIFGTLARAGPCSVFASSELTGTSLPYIGAMEFDTYDLDRLIARDQLDIVVIHEILHVLGFGTFWGIAGETNDRTLPKLKGVLVDKCTESVGYIGESAFSGYKEVGGNLQNIPVENKGGNGSRNIHWRSAYFVNEVMTATLSRKDMKLSIMTAKSLIDIGYDVNLSSSSIDRDYKVPESTNSLGAFVSPEEMIDDVVLPTGNNWMDLDDPAVVFEQRRVADKSECEHEIFRIDGSGKFSFNKAENVARRVHVFLLVVALFLLCLE